jgi:sugar lactone lactonase YvrE
MRKRSIAQKGGNVSLVAVAVLAGVAAACSSSSSGPSNPLGTLSPAANSTTVSSPFDATPDVTGANVYFTAVGPNGAGVFKVAATGGAITEVYSGAPFVSPFSIAISSDGSTLFVADAGASTATTDGGAIFSLPVGGGTPTDIGSADGMTPRGLEVDGDVLYFTGNTSTGAPGVFTMPIAGGPVTTLASGAPLQEPSGIAIAPSGTVYVVDSASVTSTHASVYQIPASGAPSVFVDNIAVGYPAGIVLNQAGSLLLVSALDTAKGTDAVLVVDVASSSVTEFTTGIDQFVEPAGLHRAKTADIFAWADSAANNTGTVYVISK